MNANVVTMKDLCCESSKKTENYCIFTTTFVFFVLRRINSSKFIFSKHDQTMGVICDVDCVNFII